MTLDLQWNVWLVQRQQLYQDRKHWLEQLRQHKQRTDHWQRLLDKGRRQCKEQWVLHVGALVTIEVGQAGDETRRDDPTMGAVVPDRCSGCFL